MCLTKDPEVTDALRKLAESKDERVVRQTEVWTYQQYLVWQQVQLQKSLSNASPRKKSKKNEDEEEETPMKRKQSEEPKPVKRLKSAEEVKPSADEAKTNLMSTELKNDGDSVKDEPSWSGGKSDSDDGDDTLEDEDHDFVGNFDSLMDSEDEEEDLPELPTEDLLKVEVKVKTEVESSEEVSNLNDTGSNDFIQDLPDEVCFNIPTFPPWMTKSTPEDDKVQQPLVNSPVKSEKPPEKELSPSQVRVPCPICGKLVKGQHNMKGHMRQVHQKLKTCRMCKRNDITDLKQHRQTEHPETVVTPGELLKCTHCTMTFKRVKYLRNHMKSQHSGKDGGKSETTICPICAKEVRNMASHMYDSHPPDGTENFPCDECDKVFPSKRYLRKHVANCHSAKLVCPVCSKLCNKNHILTAHKNDPVVCDVCSGTFKNKYALAGHKRKVHAEKVAGGLLCPECHQVFDTAYKLYMHRYHVHRECKCEFCGGSFKNSKALLNHKKAVHTEQYEAKNHAWSFTRSGQEVSSEDTSRGQAPGNDLISMAASLTAAREAASYDHHRAPPVLSPVDTKSLFGV